MFGWSKREKNDKSLNEARIILSKLPVSERGAKLSKFRKRYPNRLATGAFDFEQELIDFDQIIMYLLIYDAFASEEADRIDGGYEDLVEAAVTTEATEETIQAEVEPESVSKDTSSDDSSDTGCSFDSGSSDSCDSCDCGGDCD